MEEVTQKIYDLYLKINDKGFFCSTKFMGQFDTNIIEMSNVTMYETEAMKVILRFEHFDKSYYDLGIFINGKVNTRIPIQSTNDFDSAMKKVKELLIEKGYNDYAELF